CGLYQGETPPVADLTQSVELAREAEHVDSDDPTRAVRDRSLDSVRIEVPGMRVDVSEHRRRALEDEAVCRSHERERRRDYFVAGAEACDPAQEMKPGGPARDRGGERRAYTLGEQ